MLRLVLRVTLVLAALRAVGALVERAGTEGDATSDEFSVAVVFGGAQRVSRAASLREGSVTATLGGFQLDLREATLSPLGARLVLRSRLAGVQVLVPDEWRVVVEEHAMAGGIEARVSSDAELEADAPTLQIEAFATLGGIQVVTVDDEPAGVAGR